MLNTTPSLNCCTFRQSFCTIDTQDKIKAERGRDTLVYIQMQLPAIYLNVQITTGMYKELSTKLCVRGGPWAVVNDSTTKWLQGVNSACSLAMHV